MDGDRVTAAIAVLRNVSQERAEEKQRADFISTASHEMRTPVAAIEGYLALTLNDKVATIDTRARDYLEKAHTSTQHLGKLFQDLLTSAKAEDGRLTSHPTAIELGDFLEQLAGDLRLVAERKGLFVDFMNGTGSTINATQGGEKVVRPLYYVYVDPDRLREVITNLFDNAVKYTPEGKVTLGLTGNDQVVQCYVRDTGPGIPAEDLPHLFQKFYRVDNSATRTIGGTGLGLFICRKIIELYNGRIWAESEVGKGSSFYINLPRISREKATTLQAATNNFEITKPVNAGGTA
jgi:signal transduction histidine kinase